MQEIDVSRALAPVAGKERLVKRRFWKKVRATLGQIPFMERPIAMYYAALDPRTPAHVKTVLFAALAYFILPTDLIPDFILGLGFADDLTVLATVLQTLGSYVTAEHIDRARSFLRDQSPGSS